MRLAHIESYSKSTQIATGAFFVLFFASVPVYMAFYHIVFTGWIVWDMPIYIPDSLYCISYMYWRCLLVNVMGNLCSFGVLLCLREFASMYIAKGIGYFIGLSTLSIIVLLVYLGLCMHLKIGLRNIMNIIYGMTTILVGGVGISLIPPFCRRRAHVLAGMLVPSVNTFKLAMNIIVFHTIYLLGLPFLMNLLYMVFLYVYRSFKSSLIIQEYENVIHRAICIGSSIFIRSVCSWCIFHTGFILPSSIKKRVPKRKWAIYIGVLILSTVFGAILCTVSPDIQTLSGAGCFALFQLIKIFLEWAIPMQILRITGALDYVRVSSRRVWIKHNKVNLVYFEIGQMYMIFFITILTFSVMYSIFNNRADFTTSEISIILSFIRQVLSYIYSLVDSAMKMVFLGQRMSLPQRIVKRVTYTDIAQMYRSTMAQQNTFNACATEEHKQPEQQPKKIEPKPSAIPRIEEESEAEPNAEDQPIEILPCPSSTTILEHSYSKQSPETTSDQASKEE
ncbi:hypothetical protein NEOKW01_1978 [Nematocida sp. AWRm80]|nr:hypothetical protein NEOKW01_1978 [Nematocida sp. AWRm80]